MKAARSKRQGNVLDAAKLFDEQRRKEYLRELEERQMFALKLYEPLPFQEAYHSCRARECLLQKSTQVGGTLCGMVEVARAVLGMDPYDKYPKRDGVVALLGYGERHIGRVFHKYLFRPGAFMIVRDPETGKWRTYRPWPQDVEHFGKKGDRGLKGVRSAPPLIPSRFIDGRIAYISASEKIFSVARLKTGWEIYAFSSRGDPGQAQGFQVDLYHIDEDLATGGWHEEAVSRTSLRNGKIRWTAVPDPRTEDMMQMIHRAEEEEEASVPLEKRVTVRIIATMYDNPYYPEEVRAQNERIWRAAGEDVFARRALGEMGRGTALMYPGFNTRIHDYINYHGDDIPTGLKILQDNDGNPPENWTRYMVVDPGHTICAVEFFAVPPPQDGQFRFMYDELYMHNCDKRQFGASVASKVAGHTFQDFIIDAHGGNLRELGSGILPRRQYENELDQRGIRCVARGSYFMSGSSDVKGREEKLREWLAVKPDGLPTLLINPRRCPAFVREITRFKKKMVRVAGSMVPIDEGVRRVTHAVECCEYAAAHGLPYVTPNPSGTRTVTDMIMESRLQMALAMAMQDGPNWARYRSLGPRGVAATY